VLRLTELGELTDSEYAAIAEKANEAKLRIGTGHEHLSDGISTDKQAVETLEAVDKVRRGT
jgi:hypothetical protein